MMDLPDEIVEEILSRLPVKSLLRFKCVSKSCLSLILSDRFIKRHLEKSRSRRRPEHWQVIFGKSKNANLKRCSLCSYLDDPSVTPLPIDDPITDHLTVDSQIIGHSNGLVCVFDEPTSFFLWNPATRISIQLPKLDGDYLVKCGFGWDGESDAYKVFAVLSKRNENGNEIKRIGGIYNSKTNSWKALEHEHEHEHGSLDLLKWLGVCVRGTIHWIVSKEYIETFDLKSEVFGRIEFPGGVINPGILLDDDKKGCLSLVCDDYDNAVRTVWEMEMYGVEESWVVVSSCLINRRPKESTHMAWTTHKGKLTCSPRVNIVDCDYKRLYIESLVQPVSDNNDA